MSTNRAKTRRKRGPGRPPKHGGYSFLVKGELPENRRHIKEYLTSFREGLIADLGPAEENLTTAQLVMVDRALGILGLLRCMEEHINETSVIQDGELSPLLRNSYLSYVNALRLILRELGIDKRAAEDALDLKTYLAEKSKEGRAADGE